MTLDEQIDSLGANAMRVAEDRAALLRLVKLALKMPANGEGDFWNNERLIWQAEAEATLKRMAKR